MGILKKKIKVNPILLAILVAIIIGIVCIIVFKTKYYQQETELPPNLILKTNDGQEIELLLLSYDWNYKGEQKKYGEGLNVDSLTTYNFAGKNTLIKNHEWGLDSVEIFTSPKYKAKLFSPSALVYNWQTEGYQAGNGSIINAEEKNRFSYMPNSQTTVVTFTLYSETQGQAVYGLKTIEQYIIDIDRLKETKNLSLDKEAIFDYMKDETFGQYLNEVRLDGKKVTLIYDYFIQQYASLMFANELFTLVDDLEEIEFRTNFNKFIKNVNDPITFEHSEFELDNIAPVRYTRNSFVDTYWNLTLEELRGYIGK